MAFKEFGTKITRQKAGHIISSAVYNSGHSRQPRVCTRESNLKTGVKERPVGPKLTKQLEWSIEQFHGLRKEYIIWEMNARNLALERTEKIYPSNRRQPRNGGKADALQAKLRIFSSQRHRPMPRKGIQSLSETSNNPLLKEREQPWKQD